MMPPLLAPPTAAPNPQPASDVGPSPKENPELSSGLGDFAAVLATLAKGRPLPPPRAVPETSGDAPDGPPEAEPAPMSFEAMVAALADQASGMSSGFSLPTPQPDLPATAGPGGTATATGSPAGRFIDATPATPAMPATPATAVPRGVGAWFQAASTPAGDSLTGLWSDGGSPPDSTRPNSATGASGPGSRPGPAGAGPAVSAWAKARAGGPWAPAAIAPPAESGTGPAVAAPAPSPGAQGSGSVVSAPAHGPDTEGSSAVAALAHSSNGDGPGSAVAALVRQGEGPQAGSSATPVSGSAAASADRDARGLGSSASGPTPTDRFDAPGPVPVADNRLRHRGTGRTAGDSDASTTPAAGAEPEPAGVESISAPLATASEEAATGPDRRAAGEAGGAADSATHAIGGNLSARPAEVVAAPGAPAPPATPAAVADQIVSAVVPLHGRGDGRHEVTLELRPDDLGAIRVEVSVEHQTVHLTLHAADPATGRLLSAALPDLRSALADAGLTAGHVGVGPEGDHGTGAGAHGPSADSDTPSGRPPRPGRDDGRQPGIESVRSVRPAAAGRLDLFL